ncbi:hypothetical protein [Pseudalkalibacillus berkeleyi]|uniref:Uncharacterized protein n=1 Tax=Pseudalkalibacillus berkeleyi TaxID=1069813 RepID=A0ABS9GY99_9BACL|nr:hypothetical protein [Pseudalkalibacillus berkeleyi]MCF6136578.1 hypothetical protein [Pseudalkalibacillus berkeleyi]
MKKNKIPVWLAMLVTGAVYFGDWYVNREVVDRTDFQEVVEYQSNKAEIIQMNAYDQYGFVITEHNGTKNQSIFERTNDHWNLKATAELKDGMWGISNTEDGWLYFGMVYDSSVTKVFVGEEKAELFNAAGPTKYWLYLEPNKYNYPIKAVREIGKDIIIKDK